MPRKASKKTSTYAYDKKESNSKPKNQVESIVIFGLSILMFCMVMIPGENIWLVIHNFILSLFGMCSFLWPVLLGYIAVAGAFERTSKGKMSVKIWLSVAAIMLFCSLYYVFTYKMGQVQEYIFNQIVVQYKNGTFNKSSGLFGAVLGVPLIWAFGLIGARIVNSLLIFVSVMFLTSATLPEFFNIFSKPFKAIKRRMEEKKSGKKSKFETDLDESHKVLMGHERNSGLDRIKKDFQDGNADKHNKVTVKNNFSSKEADEIAKVTAEFIAKTKKDENKKNKAQIEIPEGLNEQRIEGDNIYHFPPLNLLNESVQPKNNDVTAELQGNGQMLVDTLKSFNVQTKIVEISRGPAVTRYELQPASGVKISKITTLADDIALNLAASGVRIEAPIPGKAAVGVEIPNKVISIVNMRELVESDIFSGSKSKLTVVLGRDISGKVMTADLAKMPHLLIAGSTGSGKSVCINSFIISLLYRANPEEVKLLMIDPKVVELGVYNGIPHLLVPVVTDPRKAAGALNWAVNEMLNRYKRFAENNVRDLGAYNLMVEQNSKLKDQEGEPLKKMPQIVIVIDELSDLMMAAPNEVEDYICRLAQMARAAGMYLVIATQRPSVDVITGIIKANIPSRIALAVSSQIDSRTILDMSGAEKLLGHGDMLFSPVGSSKPIRVQGCYVTDKEIEKIIKHIKSSQTSEYDQTVVNEIEKNAVLEKSKNVDSNTDENLDPVMQDAIKCVIEAGQASTSLLQRRLRVGYARAGRLVDEMEQMGIVGPHEGSKPRQVLITYQQFLEMNMQKSD